MHRREFIRESGEGREQFFLSQLVGDFGIERVAQVFPIFLIVFGGDEVKDFVNEPQRVYLPRRNET